MGTLTLNKNFGHLLCNSDFLPGTIKVLNLRINSKQGHLVKKMIKEDSNLSLTDIQEVETATFGKGDTKIDVLDKINDLIEKESQYLSFLNVNKIFNSFCKIYLKYLSPRCYMKECSVKDINPHNTGLINLLFSKCPTSYYNNIFDGLIKCFIAFLINEDHNLIHDKKGRWIETFSYILTNIKEKSINCNHYTISNIIHNYYNSNTKFSNNDINKLHKTMKPSTKSMIETFYKYMYPSLKYFITNKNDIFIRHGLEKNTDNYKKNMIFPPNDMNSGWRLNKITNVNNENIACNNPAYPIEYDMLPLDGCAIHSSKEIYGNVKGFINRTSFLNNGGKVHFRYDKNDKVMAREHLFGESNINIDKWVFTYNTNCSEKLRKEVKKSVKSIIVAEIPIINHEGLGWFYNNYKATINKFIMLH